MAPLFIQYDQCGTCQKAYKWLKINKIEVETRDIIRRNPTVEELRSWIALSGEPIAKFFNTSGLLYKELKIKNIMKTASQEELINLLASDGKLVRRPIVLWDNKILVGFDVEEWKAAFSSNAL